MKLLKLFLLTSIVILFSSTLYGSDTNCVPNNRTEQGTGVMIDGDCVVPPELPYPDIDNRNYMQGNVDANGSRTEEPPYSGDYPPPKKCPAGKTVDQSTGLCTLDGLSTTDALPNNLTIDSIALQKEIASIYDDTYTPPIDVQGGIDTDGAVLSVPYTVVTSPVRLPASSSSVTLDASVTEDGESGIIATFAWAEQSTLPVGSGTFLAKITIDDSVGNNDGVYNAKKLNLDDDAMVATTFHFAVDSNGREGNLTLEIIPGVRDRMFGLPDNDNNNTTHMLLYLPVTNPTTGKTWLNNNLGANYANINSAVFDPSKQATIHDDRNAFGSFFQWGRKADGHDLINWEDPWSPGAVNGTTNSRSDNPADALFIKRVYGTDGEWRVHPDNTLWALESGANNVCPIGYRIPTEEEINLERLSWESNDAEGALSSPLVWTITGERSYYDGTLHNYGTYTRYWTSTTSGGKAQYLYFRHGHPDLDPALGAYIGSAVRANGYSVRCIKD